MVRRMALLFALVSVTPAGCAAGRVEADGGRRHIFGGSVEGDEDSGSAEDSGAPNQDDTGGSPDTGVDLDTGSTGGDTGSSSGGDTGSGDTGSGDTGGDPTPPCLGIDSLDPVVATVASTDDWEEITVTLTGCATGVTVGSGAIYSGSASYAATWTAIPTDFTGTGEATLVFTGAPGHPVDSELWFTFTSDQGDAEAFTLKLTP